MATSMTRRLSLLNLSRICQKCTIQEKLAFHSSSQACKKDVDEAAAAPKPSPSINSSLPSDLARGGLTAKTPTKTQKISRAMQAYMERSISYDKMMTKEIEDYDLGKRHLANIMGQDPDLFEQEDIDRAIEYLLPSGLFDRKARPLLKHPYEVFPKRKAAQFGLDGRPFHPMFYTGKPNFYSLLHEVSQKLEELKREEDKLLRKGTLQDEASKQLILHGSDWITQQNLKDLTLEPIGDHDHKHFVVLMDRLANHPLSFKIEEFVMKYRRKLMIQSFASEVPKPMLGDNGRLFMKAEGTRKRSKAEVTLWNKGSGKFTVNGQPIECFHCVTHREQCLAPLVFTGRLGEMDVEATTSGVGDSAKSGAIRLALSRALASFVDADTREKMRIAGLLSVDFRRRERKKPGQKKARKKFTWKKR